MFKVTVTQNIFRPTFVLKVTVTQNIFCQKKDLVCRFRYEMLFVLFGWYYLRKLQLWYKQWKVRSGCLEKFALGNSRESSDFPDGRSPKGESSDPRELPWAIFFKTFHCLSDFLIKKVKIMRPRLAPGVDTEHIPGFFSSEI